MQLELLKPLSLSEIKYVVLLFRKDGKWGFFRDDLGRMQLLRYEVPACSEVENTVMMNIFSNTRSFDFEYKAAFDFTCDTTEQGSLNGRIYIVQIFSSQYTAGGLEYYHIEDIPKDIDDFENVKELLLHANIIADMYFQ